MSKTFSILVILASTSLAFAGERMLDVKNFGALPDGRSLCTSNIQAAIDACAAAGGGTVSFSGGAFVSGTITLRSHVHLQIEAGAILLGSTNLTDYPPVSSRMRHLIGGQNLVDTGISGSGVIDGRGTMSSFPGEMAITNRPYGICLTRCTNVVVQGVTLRNSAFWMQRYIECDRLILRNLTVRNHINYNNDGIDLDDSRNVVVENCVVDSDDDGICFKSSSALGCENIVVTNCIVSSHANAIKFGTASAGGFKQIKILNCQIKPSAKTDKIYGQPGGLAGLALEVVDGGIMDGVLVSGIDITGTRAPMFIRLGDRSRRFSNEPGTLRNVVIENVNARKAGDLGCAIAGIEDHPIENLTLRNIDISFAGGGSRLDAEQKMQPKDSAYPECHMFAKRLPAFGLFFWHVRGLNVENVTLQTEKPDARLPMAFEQVNGARVNGKEVGASSPRSSGNASLAQYEMAR